MVIFFNFWLLFIVAVGNFVIFKWLLFATKFYNSRKCKLGLVASVLCNSRKSGIAVVVVVYSSQLFCRLRLSFSTAAKSAFFCLAI